MGNFWVRIWILEEIDITTEKVIQLCLKLPLANPQTMRCTVQLVGVLGSLVFADFWFSLSRIFWELVPPSWLGGGGGGVTVCVVYYLLYESEVYNPCTGSDPERSLRRTKIDPSDSGVSAGNCTDRLICPVWNGVLRERFCSLERS